MENSETWQNVTQRYKVREWCWKNGTDRPAWWRVAEKLQFVKRKKRKEKKTQYLRNAMKWRAIERGLPVTHVAPNTTHLSGHQARKPNATRPRNAPQKKMWQIRSFKVVHFSFPLGLENISFCPILMEGDVFCSHFLKRHTSKERVLQNQVTGATRTPFLRRSKRAFLLIN